MSTQDKLNTIINDLTACLADAEKFDKGNASAGTRIRKTAQENKSALQDLRLLVQETKTARKG